MSTDQIQAIHQVAYDSVKYVQDTKLNYAASNNDSAKELTRFRTKMNEQNPSVDTLHLALGAGKVEGNQNKDMPFAQVLLNTAFGQQEISEPDKYLATCLTKLKKDTTQGFEPSKANPQGLPGLKSLVDSMTPKEPALVAQNAAAGADTAQPSKQWASQQQNPQQNTVGRSI